MKKLEDKVAIITGGALGIGKGIARTYAKYGAKICLIDIIPEVKNTAKEIEEEFNTPVITYIGDVSNIDDMKKAVQKTYDTFGKIDTIAANAGVCRLSPFEQFTDEMRDFHIDVNIKGTWNICRASIPFLLKNNGGTIVIASSVTGDIVADSGEAAYAMTKSALVGLTKALAVEYATRNIRVNCTQLGYARTPMVEKMAKESNPLDFESAISDIAVNVPMKRLAQTTEVGELFAFLASSESSYITGSQIVIDGAATLPETMSIGK